MVRYEKARLDELDRVEKEFERCLKGERVQMTGLERVELHLNTKLDQLRVQEHVWARMSDWSMVKYIMAREDEVIELKRFIEDIKKDGAK